MQASRNKQKQHFKAILEFDPSPMAHRFARIEDALIFQNFLHGYLMLETIAIYRRSIKDKIYRLRKGSSLVPSARNFWKWKYVYFVGLFEVTKLREGRNDFLNLFLAVDKELKKNGASLEALGMGHLFDTQKGSSRDSLRRSVDNARFFLRKLGFGQIQIYYDSSAATLFQSMEGLPNNFYEDMGENIEKLISTLGPNYPLRFERRELPKHINIALDSNWRATERASRIGKPKKSTASPGIQRGGLQNVISLEKIRSFIEYFWKD
jgi:hypothetical protein